MPSDELCQVEAVPFTGSRANRIMFAANGKKIKSQGEKKFKAVTDEGVPVGTQIHLGRCQEDLEVDGVFV